MRKTFKPLSLNSRGVSHVLVPLVVVVGLAIAGTFALVASHAASTKNSSSTGGLEAKTSKGKKPQKSYLVVYGTGQGYTKVKVKAVSVNTKTHTCGGAWNSKDEVEKNLSKPTTSIARWGQSKGKVTYWPTKISCTATGPVGQYSVYFGNDKGYKASPIAVDMDEGTCVVIHSDPASTEKRPLVNGKCGHRVDDEANPKLAAAVRVLPEVKGNAINQGFVEIAVPGRDLTLYQCTGSLTLSVTSAETGAKVTSKSVPIKQAKAKTKDAHDYCVAGLRTLRSTELPSGHSYTLTATLDGNDLFDAPAASVNIAIK